MNKLKKTLVLVCCAALLVCISVGATVAYLTSKTDVVNNTFTVGDIVITLDEAPVDAMGNVVTGNRVTNNDYKLLPGHTYTKDPTIHVDKDSEEAYIRTFVTVTKFNEIAAIIRAKYETETVKLTDKEVAAKMSDCISGYNKDIWEDTAKTITIGNDNTVTYEFRKKTSWKPNDATDIVLFNKLTVPSWVDNAQLETIAGMDINVVAYAIQVDGFGGDADKAWSEYDGENAGVPVYPTATPAVNG